MIPAATLSELAPSGTLRVGINYGNTVLVQRNTVTGELNGLAPDLARELARRAGVPVVLVPYDTAGKMADAVKAGAWDVAFLAVDPQRAADIEFTAPYLEIEGAYMVPAGSKIASNDEVDREGVRIAVGLKRAYDLYLTRNIKRATIVRAQNSQAAIDEFVAKNYEVVAGVKQPIISASAGIPGARVLAGRFMAIGQASGVPKGRDAAARYLREYIEDVKASGFVAESLKKSGVGGATVAPPG